jgi:hypothetical protein
MQASDIEIGVEYALREPPRSRVPFQRVPMLERVRGGQWSVEWIEPNVGLTDFVKSASLVTTWTQHKAYLRSEERHEALARLSAQQWDSPDGPLTDAVNLVFEASTLVCC